MATIIAMKGAKLNKNLSAPAGVIPSFTNNFTVSASDCNIPLGPTRLGPRRICIHAETFLSMITNTSPSIANKPITHTPAITISMTIVQIGLKVALNQLSINFDILEKLHITPTTKGALYIFNKKCYQTKRNLPPPGSVAFKPPSGGLGALPVYIRYHQIQCPHHCYQVT